MANYNTFISYLSSIINNKTVSICSNKQFNQTIIEIKKYFDWNESWNCCFIYKWLLRLIIYRTKDGKLLWNYIFLNIYITQFFFLLYLYKICLILFLILFFYTYIYIYIYSFIDILFVFFTISLTNIQLTRSKHESYVMYKLHKG